MIIIAAAAFGTLISCSFFEEEDRLEKSSLFTLDLGRMEDQVDMIEVEGRSRTAKTRIFMQDGLYYISNGHAAKVMEFNSYGDLLRLFYNSRVNPDPIWLAEGDFSGPLTKAAYRFPFKENGEIAVDQENRLYVEEIIESNRREYDKELNALLNRVILIFEPDGTCPGYLGQEGLNGTPFPYIKGLHVNDRGEIVVISRTSEEWLVFWFTSELDPLYVVSLPLRELPEGGKEKVTPYLESIYPDRTERIVYLKIDYYGTERESISDSSGNFKGTSVYPLFLETGQYGEALDIPRRVVEREDPFRFEPVKQEVIYSLIGTARGGHLFFMSPIGNEEYELLILGAGGKIKGRTSLLMAEESLYYKDLHVSREGIVSALLCSDYRIEIANWRSDEMIEEERHESGFFGRNEPD